MGNTGKVFNNCYLDKNEMTLSTKAGNKVTGQVKFRLDQKVGQKNFKTADNKFIVGIYSYRFEYPGSDHHVKKITLKIDPKLQYGSDQIQEVLVDITGEMSDLSDHSSDTLKIGLSLVAISDNVHIPRNGENVLENGENIVTLVALQGFNAEFSDSDDHHVKEYSAGISSNGTQGTAWIADDSKHNGSGIAIGQQLQVPASVLGLMISEDVQFINDFKLAKDSGDHHILHTGITYINGHADFDLTDNHRNFATPGCCHCYANTYKQS